MPQLARYSDMAAMGFDDGFGNREPHACSVHLHALITPAVELIED